jgi:hypothetical protein
MVVHGAQHGSVLCLHRLRAVRATASWRIACLRVPTAVSTRGARAFAVTVTALGLNFSSSFELREEGRERLTLQYREGLPSSHNCNSDVLGRQLAVLLRRLHMQSLDWDLGNNTPQLYKACSRNDCRSD